MESRFAIGIRQVVDLPELVFSNARVPVSDSGDARMNEITSTPKSTAAAVRPTRADMLSPMGWLLNEIDRMFEDFGPSRRVFNFAPQAVAPALEMVDDGKAYRLTAELPGLAESDVELNVADGRLTISGEKKEEQERKDKGYMLSERRYGSFRRQLTLPPDVDPKAITAKFKDGVLTITLPKDEQAASRTHKITIEK
jgi:HSP20 family protein